MVAHSSLDVFLHLINCYFIIHDHCPGALMTPKMESGLYADKLWDPRQT
jgi:hypothetical protein